MATPLGVLKDTTGMYNPTKFEADRPNGLGVIANRVFLKGPSKATSSLSLRSRKLVPLSENSSHSLKD